MTRKLASIQRILELAPIEGADKIEVATVLGWHCVVKKNEFKIGDFVVYIEVDAFLPQKPEFEFLAKAGTKKMIVDGREIVGYRIKTVKLRGQISQGIVFPVSILPRSLYPTDITNLEGTDVTDYLEIHKYEIPLPAELAGKVRGGFPGFLPKTDEPRLQAYPQLLEKYNNHEMPSLRFYVTEKIDGSSCTFVIKNDEFHVCSRNLDLLDNDKNIIWKVAKEMDIEGKLRTANKLAGSEKFALQGEIVGPGIQNNTLKLAKHTILFFNVYSIVDGEYLDYFAFEKVMRVIELPIVPVLGYDWVLFPTIEDMVRFSTRKSMINQFGWAEGLVWRSVKNIKDEDIGRLSFKVLNPMYLLEEEK